MQTAFNLSSDYELMYWEMCYNHEQWPHQCFNKQNDFDQLALELKR